MMTREQRTAVNNARNPMGDPRFYPPGQHPATFRMRQTLLALIGAPILSAQVEEAVNYYADRIIEIEIGEQKALEQFLQLQPSRD